MKKRKILSQIDMTSIPVLQIFYLIEDLHIFFSSFAAGIPGRCFLIFFTFLSPQSFVHLRQKYFEQLTFKIFSTINILFGANSSRQTDSLSIHSLQTIVFFFMNEKKTDPRYFYPSVWLGNVFPREKSLNTSFPVQVSPYGDLRLQLLLACIYWSDGLVKVWLVSSNQSIFLLGKIICTINGETRANSVFWRFSRANEV